MLALAALGCLYAMLAAGVIRSFFAQRTAIARRGAAVTILKPLHGAEPRLAENLAGFLDQDYDGPVQLLCGVQRADDPAIAAVEALRVRFPKARIDLVVDATAHGASGKISNLINMDVRAAHPIVVMSDSDMVVGPDYLTRVLSALDAPGVGAVSCLYRGRGDAGFWSRLGASGLSYQFLPGAIFGVAKGLARPCMGSTIALRRETLDRIGGFAAFADVLADDYAIGAAVAALGLRVAVPPMLVTHASAEPMFSALWRHELRWGATVRDVERVGYVLSVIALPFPIALLAMFYWPATGAGLALLAFLVRARLARTVDRVVGDISAPLWLLPPRDCLSLAVFVASFFVRSVDWRGATLRIENHGRVSADTEFPA